MAERMEEEVLGPSLEEDEEVETMTALEVLEKLEEAWMNEKLSPELLPPQMELVDCMLDQIEQMEKNLSRVRRTDFRVPLHKMEMQRIRYMITSYLRTRLEKVEHFVWHLLEEEEKAHSSDSQKPSVLSPNELQFARDYAGSMETHLTTVALRHIPGLRFQSLQPEKIKIQPNIDAYVFLKVKRNIDGLLLEESTTDLRDEEVDLEKGTQHIMRYKPVAPLVQSGSVQLI